MESRGSDFYNANQLENDEAKRRVIPNLPRRPQPTFIEKTNNQTNPANTLDTSFQRSHSLLTQARAFTISRRLQRQRIKCPLGPQAKCLSCIARRRGIAQ